MTHVADDLFDPFLDPRFELNIHSFDSRWIKSNGSARWSGKKPHPGVWRRSGLYIYIYINNQSGSSQDSLT